MPRRRPPHHPSSRERIFEDEDGLLWTAFRPDTPRDTEAVVFVCVSNSRVSPRAISPADELKLEEADEVKLRQLLLDAPRLGNLQ
ncbi:MAG TPA: hypothetical protein VJ812_02605 [Gemmatimonadaceae bacterium]|jgi:hypothetical protein|nr:hypothetical protein [Gemmatimonadaceae bacterium]